MKIKLVQAVLGISIYLFGFAQLHCSTIVQQQESSAETSNVSFTVREAISSDSVQISSLVYQLGYSISPEEIVEKIQLFSKSAYDKIWVAEIASQVCGILAVNVMNLLEVSAPYKLHLDVLSVDQSFRQLGIGRALVEHAEMYAKSIGCKEVVLTSRNYREIAHIFYKKLGYQVPAITYFSKNLN